MCGWGWLCISLVWRSLILCTGRWRSFLSVNRCWESVIVSFDKNVQERDCTVLFKFNGEFDICVRVIEVVQKLACCVFICRTRWIYRLRIQTKQKVVQSLNSPFFPPHVGAEPGRAKRESRITYMRMLRTNQSKITRSQQYYAARVNVSRNAFYRSRSSRALNKVTRDETSNLFCRMSLPVGGNGNKMWREDRK